MYRYIYLEICFAGKMAAERYAYIERKLELDIIVNWPVIVMSAYVINSIHRALNLNQHEHAKKYIYNSGYLILAKNQTCLVCILHCNVIIFFLLFLCDFSITIRGILFR